MLATPRARARPVRRSSITRWLSFVFAPQNVFYKALWILTEAADPHPKREKTDQSPPGAHNRQRAVPVSNFASLALPRPRTE